MKKIKEKQRLTDHVFTCYTDIVNTGVGMERQNITLSIPKVLLKKARHLAVERGTSLSGLLASFLEQLVDEDQQVRRAQRRILQRLKKGYDLGTKGKIDWTRDSIHER